MSVFSAAKDMFTVVSKGASAAGDLVSAGVKLVEGEPDVAAAKLQKFAADGRDCLEALNKVRGDLPPWAQKILDNPKFERAKTPILAAAQLAIMGMRATTGFGAPDTGESFRESTKLFEEARDIYAKAHPAADQWDGAASREYTKRDSAQYKHADLLGDGDSWIWSVLDKEAAQINATRETLDDWSRYLYDYGLATFAIGLLGSPGKAAQFALEGAAAALALGFTGESMWRLVDDSLHNAAEIKQAIDDTYKKANQEVVKGLACDPFGDERNQLPTRLNPPVPDRPPAPTEPPPPLYPPAKPLGESGPPAPGPAVPGPLPPSAPAPAPAPAPRFAPPAAAASPPATAAPTPGIPAAPSSPSPALGAQSGRSGERAPVTSPRSTPTVDEPTPAPAR